MKTSDADKKVIWKKVYEFVATLDTQGFEMMNFGYEGSETGEGSAGGDDERGAHQLYQHVIGRVELAGKNVLEVGCGRGGGAVFAKHQFAPAQLHGLDYSPKAIEVCRQRYSDVEGLSFVCGDAEDLPFAAGEFDAVINIESSHCYASRLKFYEETWRVLKPGGDFLYADFFPAQEECVKELTGVGFELLVEEDITAGVVRSLERDHARKEKLFRHLPQPRRGNMENWAGLVGSTTYEAFRTRRYTYRSYHLRKSAPS